MNILAQFGRHVCAAREQICNTTTPLGTPFHFHHSISKRTKPEAPRTDKQCNPSPRSVYIKYGRPAGQFHVPFWGISGAVAVLSRMSAVLPFFYSRCRILRILRIFSLLTSSIALLQLLLTVSHLRSCSQTVGRVYT